MDENNYETSYNDYIEYNENLNNLKTNDIQITQQSPQKNDKRKPIRQIIENHYICDNCKKTKIKRENIFTKIKHYFDINFRITELENKIAIQSIKHINDLLAKDHKYVTLKQENTKTIETLKNQSKHFETKLNETLKKYNYEISEIEKQEILIKKPHPNFIQRFFKKFQKQEVGYIFYINPIGNLEIIGIYESINTFIKNKNRHELIDKIGTHKGLPCFLVHHDSILSLSIEKNEILWDPETWYNLINHIIKRKLTKGENTLDLGNFFKKYWWVILIILILVIAIGSPQGQQFIKQFIVDLKLNQVGK